MRQAFEKGFIRRQLKDADKAVAEWPAWMRREADLLSDQFVCYNMGMKKRGRPAQPTKFRVLKSGALRCGACAHKWFRRQPQPPKRCPCCQKLLEIDHAER